MKRGYLSEFFSGVAAKKLSAVEVDPNTSNQHEFNGVSRLKKIFGIEKRTIHARFFRLCDTEGESISADGALTWYDARANHPSRTEYRLYFTNSPVTQGMKAGDLFVLALRPDGSALCITAEAGSTSANQLIWLFGINCADLGVFVVSDETEADGVELRYASRLILDEIGVEQIPEQKLQSLLEKLIEKFPNGFPSTRDFSRFARELSEVSLSEGPDKVLMHWMETEEIAFKAMERHIIAERLKLGFQGRDDVDVDAFISFSLSVQNRRKSRAGYALENHLEEIFTHEGISYSRTQETENRSKPDFLFPSVAHYKDHAYPVDRLTMLAAKTTAKDRWRQIVGEANRISQKHLITLEPSISPYQTDEMAIRNVKLVLPREIHASYTDAQRLQLMDLEDFCSLLHERQGG